MLLINLARLPTRHYVTPYIRLSPDWSIVAFYPLLRDNCEKSTDGNRKMVIWPLMNLQSIM